MKQLAARSFIGSFILFTVLGGAGLGTGCGGKKGTLSVDIQVPVGDDPFVQATQAVITVGDPIIMQRIQPVTGGHFEATIQFDLKSRSGLTGPVIVEARDGSGRVLGYGRTPPLAIIAVDEVVTVWVGRPGRAGRSPSDLTRGRVGIAAGTIPRLGVLLAGGTVNGTAVGDAEVYHEYTHTVLKAESIPTPRSGAVIIGFDRVGATAGASLLVSGATPALTAELTAFDPVATGSTAGRWTALANDDSLKRVNPALTLLPGGSWLVCGGRGSDNLPLASATQLAVGAQLLINKTEDMKFARVGARAIGGEFAGEDGALIVGGNQDGEAAVERFAAPTRRFFAVTDSETLMPRTGQSVTQLTSQEARGKVIVAGGYESGAPTTAVASGWTINPSTLEILPRSDLLRTARARHAAFVAGNEFIVCGGVDETNQALANCEAYDGTTLAYQRTFTLAVPRKDLVAVPLETGEILLASGLDDSDRPVTAIELYTPAR